MSDQKTTVMIEAGSFEENGGWVLDQQYMDQMGSPVLLAHGMGKPVHDAVTHIKLPKPGIWRVWVRTRNWTAPWNTSHPAGTFTVSINNVALPPLFGSQGMDWHWHYGGKISVDNDRVEIRLHDLTGFDGRCSALLFTEDAGYTPPEGLAAYYVLRETHLGLGKNPVHAGAFDFIVVGGGIAGICTAVSGARKGLKVAFLHDRPVLGGNNSSEVRVHLGGEINLKPFPVIGNIVKEIGPDEQGNARPAQIYMDERKLHAVCAEKNISLFLGHHLVSAHMDNGAIKSIVARDIRSGVDKVFYSGLFADCTGDGALGFLAGADFRMGRESNAETGEALAPERSDRMTMGASVQWYSVEKREKSLFPECPWAIQCEEATAQKVIMGEWDWETGMDQDQVNDAERVRDNGLRAVYGNWSFLKNHSADREKYAHRELGWVAFVAGKRESRRLLGEIILRQQDIESNVHFPDACFTTTWSLDLHYPNPENAARFPGQAFRSIARMKEIEPYAVPYRTLYSRNISNLFMAGRNISVTHVALGTVRVMRTGGMMGEVVGIAAWLCKSLGTTPACVYTKYLEKFKDALNTGKF